VIFGFEGMDLKMNSQKLLKAVASLMVIIIEIFYTNSVLAQEFPVQGKTITFVLPYAPGGPTDKAARDLAVSMGKFLGDQTIIVENVPGASGVIGINKVAKSNPDGYTLLFTHIAYATLPSFFKKLSYSPEKDFEFLGLVSENPMNLISRNSMPAKNIQELVDWIRSNKEKTSIANAGPGTASHLCGMLFQSTLRLDMTSVPYKGTAPAMADLIGGQIDLLCDQTTATIAQVEGKKVKSYAVTTNKRLVTPLFKDTPTMQESGFKDFSVTIWQGLYAPKNTPAWILKRLNDALKLAVKDSDFVRKQEQGGASVITDSRLDPVGHKAFVMSEMARWAPIISAAGIYSD
jgi:tripartite-type tricarboxylate transporter receptor subunit TctC